MNDYEQDWVEYRKLVLAQLEWSQAKIEKLEERLAAQNVKLAVHMAKTSFISSIISGAVAVGAIIAKGL